MERCAGAEFKKKNQVLNYKFKMKYTRAFMLYCFVFLKKSSIDMLMMSGDHFIAINSEKPKKREKC